MGPGSHGLGDRLRRRAGTRVARRRPDSGAMALSVRARPRPIGSCHCARCPVEHIRFLRIVGRRRVRGVRGGCVCRLPSPISRWRSRRPEASRGHACSRPSPEPGPPEAARRKVPEAPFLDLVQYIVLRASQCLGEIPLDESGQQRVLPREAKEYIDLLSTLREHLGNDLPPEAARAVDGVLTDLRTRYLEVT